MKLKASFGSNVVAPKWEDHVNRFMTKIHLEGIDRMGILQEIIHAISITLSINIRRLNIGVENGVFSCELIVLVEDTNVVTRMCKRLKSINGVKVATRINE